MRGPARHHLTALPREALLLIEVSASSLSHDRGRKLAAYARNAVPEYWIIDLQAEKLEVYRDPAGEAYASQRILGRGEAISPLHAPEATIAVADLLP